MPGKVRLSLVPATVAATAQPLSAVGRPTVAAVSHTLQSANRAAPPRRDQWMLSVAKASLLMAAVIVVSTIAIGAAFRSGMRYLALPARARG
jgi:hypothetical protein